MNSSSNSVGAAAPAIAHTSRNALCPCGSGKRFKACHGAAPVSDGTQHSQQPSGAPARPQLDVAEWSGLSRELRQSLSDTMHSALAALQSGEHARAEQSFRAVLAIAPDTPDALSMLGVSRFFLGDYAEAEQLIRKAISIAGSNPMYDGNLRLCLDRQRLEKHALDGTYEAATALLREYSGTLAAVDETTEWTQLLLEYAVHFVEFVGPADVLSCGSWLLITHLAAQLPAGVGFSLRAIRSTGAPLIPIEIPGATLVPDGEPRLRVVIGASPMSLIMAAGAPVSAPKATILLIDRDQPEDLLDLVFNLDQLGGQYRVVAATAYLAEKTGFPLLARSAHERADPTSGVLDRRRRVGVFVPDIDAATAAERWNLIEEIRRMHPAMDLLYSRPLPAEHLPSAGEHLISIVDARLPALSRGWHSLVFWGGGRNWQQFDVLLRAFEVPNLIAHVTTGAVTPQIGQYVHFFCSAEQAIQAVHKCARGLEQRP